MNDNDMKQTNREDGDFPTRVVSGNAGRTIA